MGNGQDVPQENWHDASRNPKGKETQNSKKARLTPINAVSSYLDIPGEKGEEAVAWLDHEVAKKRPITRPPDYQNWKAEHYKVIWARARRLGLSKLDVYAIVYRRFDVRVTSLNQLPERKLKRLYETLMEMDR